jgi:hypothetical protein
MKYVKAYHVDAKDGRPASEYPLRHGPAWPSDALTASIVDRREYPAVIIGTLPDDEPLPAGATEITQAKHAELVKSFNDWREQYAADQLAKARDRAKLSRAEFKLALLERDELENVKTAMSDPNADPRAVILWEDANEFWRTNEDLLTLAAALGYTEAELDEVFGITI